MLNEKGERELVYVAKVTDIKEIEGADKVELAYINGWHVMVRKGQFEVGDLCVYFEIDSLLPCTNDAFSFMEKYHYKVKTQKYFKGTVISQGLIMTLEELGLNEEAIKEEVFLTERLGVKYYEPEDNERKADGKKLVQMRFEKLMSRWEKKHPKISKIKLFRKLKEWEWSIKRLLKEEQKKKSKKAWPYWVSKTDEERIQNCFNQMKSLNKKWIATEKIDGTSTTFTMLQNKPKKRELIICSRNVVMINSKKTCYYEKTEGNVYREMGKKYEMNIILDHILNEHPEYEFVTIQGETYGGKIQKRDYGPEHKLAVFNFIYKKNGSAPVRLNPIEMTKEINNINEELKLENKLECVPVVNECYELPETCDEVIEYAHGKSMKDDALREGIVFRSEDGINSFKAVDPLFLLKYHNVD